MPQLKILDHPIVSDIATQLRDETTPSAAFRRLTATLGALLAYEATDDLPTHTNPVTTPLTTTTGTRLSQPVTVVPILRAGLGLADGVLNVLPEARVGHLGMARDEQTLKPTSYYANLPTDAAQGPVLVTDPMLATGGSAVAALDWLKQQGCQDLRLLSMIAAPEGIQRVQKEHPEVRIIVAVVDEKLNDAGYIVPGLGDAGDRLYGTA